MISLRIEGYRKDSEQLYNAIHEISCTLYQQFHCDSFIQVDYLICSRGIAAALNQPEMVYVDLAVVPLQNKFDFIPQMCCQSIVVYEIVHLDKAVTMKLLVYGGLHQ